ncbi:hypothetical protein K502DRAFT_345548 [Neoconidiobolus thromboides FSU 785]|nr:hypothetical protein K502DRAFT_345548 [Neoconidiobolus thromboides FSU 785]
MNNNNNNELNNDNNNTSDNVYSKEQQDSEKHIKKLESLLKKAKEKVPIEIKERKTDDFLSDINVDDYLPEDLKQVEWESELSHRSLLGGESDLKEKLDKYTNQCNSSSSSSSEESQEEEDESKIRKDNYSDSNSNESDSEFNNDNNSGNRGYYATLEENFDEEDSQSNQNNTSYENNTYMEKYRRYMLGHLNEDHNSSIDDFNSIKTESSIDSNLDESGIILTRPYNTQSLPPASDTDSLSKINIIECIDYEIDDKLNDNTQFDNSENSNQSCSYSMNTILKGSDSSSVSSQFTEEWDNEEAYLLNSYSENDDVSKKPTKGNRNSWYGFLFVCCFPNIIN